MSAQDGGPAFPIETTATPYADGMSLRQWYAGQALPGLIVGYTHAYGSPTSAMTEIVSEAISYADEMLYQLATRTPGGAS